MVRLLGAEKFRSIQRGLDVAAHILGSKSDGYGYHKLRLFIPWRTCYGPRNAANDDEKHTRGCIFKPGITR